MGLSLFFTFIAISTQLQAAVAIDQSTTSKNDTLVGWTSSGPTRGTLDIISSSLVVIVLCSWSVLHCNIPAPSENALKRMLRLVKYTIVTIVAPEATFMVAIVELQTARRDSKLLKSWYTNHSKEKEEKAEREKVGNEKVEKENAGNEKVEKENIDKGNSVEKVYPVGDEEADFRKIATMVAAHWLITLGKLRLVNPPEPPHPEEGFTHVNKYQKRTRSLTDADPPGTVFSKEILPFERFLTITHAYYANMGGIRVKVGSNPATYYCITAKQLATVSFDENFSPLKHLTITEADIHDKSKLDRMTQLITVSQILWLILSVLERKISGLNCTQLEILALAFSVQAIATYIAFSKKPNNVEQPTVISFKAFSENPDYDEAIRTELANTSLLSVCKPWISHSDTPEPGTPSTVRVLTDSFDLTAVTNLSTAVYLALAIIYNGIHVLAWDFTFPTSIERKMWRIASVTTLAQVLFMGLESELLRWGYKSRVLKSPHEEKGMEGWLNCLVRIIIVITIPTYGISRLILIGIAFSSLRRLPEDVYVTTWSRYIPNFS